MKVLNATVNWMHGWGNSPCLFLLVDQIPPVSEARYQFKQYGQGEDHGFYFSEQDGYVRFYYYHGPDRGFGGATLNLTLVDGSEVELIGPWSSRPACLTKEGFPACTGVTITDDEKVWQRGYTFYAGNVLLDIAREAIEKFCPYAKMGTRVRHGETRYYPVWSGEEDKPPMPPKSDPRWPRQKYPMWPTGMAGSELRAPKSEVWANKSPAIVEFLNKLMPFDPRERVCATCGGDVSEFRDSLSRKEWTISGMCQKCQDAVFFEEE